MRHWSHPGALLAILLTVGPAPGRADDAPVAPAAAKKAETVITVADAAARVEEVRGQLARIEAKAGPTPNVTEIEKGMPAATAAIAELAARDRETLAAGSDLVQLDSFQGRWAQDGQTLAEWDRKLAQRAAELDGALGELDDLRGVWERTRARLAEANAPSELLQRADAVMGVIAATRTTVAGRRDGVLTLRNQVAQQRAVVADLQSLIEEGRRRLLLSLWARDQPPLWRPGEHTATTPVLTRVRAALAREREDFQDFIGGERGAAQLAFGVLALLIAGALWLARGAGRWRDEGVDIQSATLLVERPISAAIVLWVLLLTWMSVPLVVRRVASVILLPPVARLLTPLLGPSAPTAVAFLASLLLLDRLVEVFVSVHEVARPLLLVEIAVALAAARWIRKVWVHDQERERFGGYQWWVGRLLRLAEGVLVMAAAASIVGYRQIAGLFGNGVVLSGCAALAMWVMKQVLDGVVAVVFQIRPLSTLHMVQRNRQRIIRRVRGLTGLVLAGSWAVIMLRQFHLLTVVNDTVRSVLSATVAVGQVEVSLGDVLVFAIGVALAVGASRTVHVVLEDEVLSRVSLPRGMPYAISTFSGYAVLLLGLVTALAAAGIDLSRLSLVLGALGVGIGFGLQEIVKDLVAGAVLLFERPIQLGDVVQMGDLSGDVRRIGLRSSTVHTFDGAEVIVPNSTFTSSQIVNWTLSDRMRRVDLSVGVAYGTDPHRVIALLEEVARRHADVLEEPPPRALFTGFGDSALAFQVRAWTTRVDQTATMQSELGLQVHAALVENGITVPFPQRDVYLHRVEPSGGGTENA